MMMMMAKLVFHFLLIRWYEIVVARIVVAAAGG